MVSNSGSQWESMDSHQGLRDRRQSAGWTVPGHPSPRTPQSDSHEHDFRLWTFPVGQVSRREQACSTRGVELPADARGQSTPLSFLDTSAGPRDAPKGMISLENKHQRGGH